MRLRRRHLLRNSSFQKRTTVFTNKCHTCLSVFSFTYGSFFFVFYQGATPKTKVAPNGVGLVTGGLRPPDPPWKSLRSGFVELVYFLVTGGLRPPDPPESRFAPVLLNFYTFLLNFYTFLSRFAPVFVELLYFFKSTGRWKYEGELSKSC